VPQLCRTYSSYPSISSLNPYFITGIADAESSFSISIAKNAKLKTGWRVKASFEIGLNTKDSLILFQIKEFFGGIGSFRKDTKNDALKFSVNSLKDLITIIIPHFKKYPLLTQKAADFLFFSQIIELMNNGEHLTLQGLENIISIKASMNKGLSNIIKENFSNIIPVKRPLIQTNEIPDPNWISGFVCGDGNFDVLIREAQNLTGSRVSLRFRITQHERDIELLKLIIKYFDAGILEKDVRDPNYNLVIGKFSDINTKITSFFKKYPICGIKQLDFLDWCRIVDLINLGSHLTKEGLEEIKKLKSGMNKGRKI